MGLMRKIVPDAMEVIDLFTADEVKILMYLRKGGELKYFDIVVKEAVPILDGLDVNVIHIIHQSPSDGWVCGPDVVPCTLSVRNDGSVDEAEHEQFNYNLDCVYNGIRRNRLIANGFLKASNVGTFAVQKSAINRYLNSRNAALSKYLNAQKDVDKLIKTIQKYGEADAMQMLIESGKLPSYFYTVAQHAAQK